MVENHAIDLQRIDLPDFVWNYWGSASAKMGVGAQITGQSHLSYF